MLYVYLLSKNKIKQYEELNTVDKLIFKNCQQDPITNIFISTYKQFPMAVRNTNFLL